MGLNVRRYLVVALMVAVVLLIGTTSQVSAWDGKPPEVFKVFDMDYREFPESAKNTFIESFCKNYPGNTIKEALLWQPIGKDGSMDMIFAVVNKNELYRVSWQSETKKFYSVSKNNLMSSEIRFLEKMGIVLTAEHKVFNAENGEVITGNIAKNAIDHFLEYSLLDQYNIANFYIFNDGETYVNLDNSTLYGKTKNIKGAYEPAAALKHAKSLIRPSIKSFRSRHYPGTDSEYIIEKLISNFKIESYAKDDTTFSDNKPSADKKSSIRRWLKIPRLPL